MGVIVHVDFVLLDVVVLLLLDEAAVRGELRSEVVVERVNVQRRIEFAIGVDGEISWFGNAVIGILFAGILAYPTGEIIIEGADVIFPHALASSFK